MIEPQTATPSIDETSIDDSVPMDQANSPVDAATAVSDNNARPAANMTGVEKVTISKGSTMKKPTPALIAVMLIVPIIAGVATGFGLEKLFAQGDPQSNTLSDGTKLEQVPTASIKPGDIFGSADESTFKDQAQGVLQSGGFDGEGSHKLLRPGGDDQTVYLTSSITDLGEFENMEVKVWGETFKGQKAGWLMDVGRIEVLNTNGELPEWAAELEADE